MALNDYFIEKLNKAFPFKPTQDQSKLFEHLAKFISISEPTNTDYSDILIINGYAGTGKTSAISALVQVLEIVDRPYKLLAPTGRSAKVLSGYAGKSAHTIHKQIYRQKSVLVGNFVLAPNKLTDCIIIVDEVSLITTLSGDNTFGSGNLLEDLIMYVRQGKRNKLILMGDSGQLPPIGLERSPALDINEMTFYGNCDYCELKAVVRQSQESGILYNATVLRFMQLAKSIGDSANSLALPKFDFESFPDIEKITGNELIECINDAYERYGEEDTVILCRSNKRANRYNAGIRATVLFREEQLTSGDRLMVVKNCYQFLDKIPELDFIANGDVAELLSIKNHEDRYGLHYADARLRFPDYKDVEIDAKVILDTLTSERASLDQTQYKALWDGINKDYAHITTKSKRYKSIREDKYYNALQIKFSYAVTGHKSQGGQWKAVFIDNPFWKPDVTIDEIKWFYTAITRAIQKVYLVNFPNEI
ncbi:MAG: AAA family ATPase [Bacteroidales bacterium]